MGIRIFAYKVTYLLGNEPIENSTQGKPTFAFFRVRTAFSESWGTFGDQADQKSAKNLSRKQIYRSSPSFRSGLRCLDTMNQNSD